jgi:hypothetical protein
MAAANGSDSTGAGTMTVVEPAAVARKPNPAVVLAQSGGMDAVVNLAEQQAEEISSLRVSPHTENGIIEGSCTQS